MPHHIMAHHRHTTPHHTTPPRHHTHYRTAHYRTAPLTPRNYSTPRNVTPCHAMHHTTPHHTPPHPTRHCTTVPTPNRAAPHHIVGQACTHVHCPALIHHAVLLQNRQEPHHYARRGCGEDCCWRTQHQHLRPSQVYRLAHIHEDIWDARPQPQRYREHPHPTLALRTLTLYLHSARSTHLHSACSPHCLKALQFACVHAAGSPHKKGDAIEMALRADATRSQIKSCLGEVMLPKLVPVTSPFIPKTYAGVFVSPNEAVLAMIDPWLRNRLIYIWDCGI